jgi:phosphoglycerate dehydrogenase-like enzyme
MKVRILEPEGFPEAALDRLRTVADVELGASQKGDPDVEAVFVRLAQRLGPQFQALYPNLRWIVSPTTGLNHIDNEHFAAHEVEVISLRGRTEFLDQIHATAEHTLALALALFRHLPNADRSVRGGEWNRYAHKGRELHGKTVFILGYGRIGRLVAPLYQAFGCRVVAHDCVTGRVPEAFATDYPSQLAEADILSIHLPFEKATENLVDDAVLARLPSRAVVINTSRGEIVDQEALLRAIEEDRLSGAALDVLQGEPAPLSPGLLARIHALDGRVLITPHIGGFTYESLEAVELFITDVFLDALDAQS